jgi:hypothetical protein
MSSITSDLDNRDAFQKPVDEERQLAVLKLLRKELLDVLIPSPKALHGFVAIGDHRRDPLEEILHALSAIFDIEVEAPSSNSCRCNELTHIDLLVQRPVVVEVKHIDQ